MSLQKLNDNDIVQGGNVHKFSCNQKRVAENFDGQKRVEIKSDRESQRKTEVLIYSRAFDLKFEIDSQKYEVVYKLRDDN